MNNKISVRKCDSYNTDEIYDLIADIYEKTEGPPVKGKKILLKPNILTDDDPSKCICTHPAVVEAMIRFLQSEGATVFVGDSPAVHSPRFIAVKTGISGVCEKTGATWVDFMKNPIEKKLRKGRIRIASIVDEVDLIISMPKFKNHELVYFTGAIKNTLGLVPGFSKAKQHALHQDRNSFSEFLIDLNEAVLPDYFLMDAIMGMEGPGPGRGKPVSIGLLIGSTNPLITDMFSSKIAGYEPIVIPTSKIAFFRKKWLQNEEDIIFDGPDIETLIKKDFKRIAVTTNRNIALQFLKKRIRPLRKIERRPVFNHNNCTGCKKCIKICPVNAIEMHPDRKNHVVLTDGRCIRCFCCSEVCMDDAVEVKRKLFGV